jgi:hypothetical protein
MPRRSSPGPAALLALGLGGVVAGHTLVYRLLVPDAHARAAELAATGHGYLSGVGALATAASVAALALVFLGGVLRAPVLDGARIARRLVAFQVTAFFVMEVLERVASGAGSRGLPAALLVGLPAQALVAVAIAALVRWLVRAGGAVTRSPREVVTARPALVALTITDGAVLARGVAWARRGRAPPAFLPI